MTADSQLKPNGGALLELKGIELAFDGRKVLQSVNLTVRGGRIIALIGPNGAGKSTLLKVALGLLRPDRGEVRLERKVRIGYVPQRLQIDPILPLTVRRFLSLSRRHSEKDLLSVLNEVGADYILDQAVQDLSGGETQRMLLARALLRDPGLLLLDEPLQGVDFAGQIALFQLIEQVRKQRGCGVVMVSHDLHLVMAGTDEVVCLNHHVCCSGKPEAVTHHPEYLALFGPKAARTLAVYTHHHDHEHDLSGDPLPQKNQTGSAGKGHRV